MQAAAARTLAVTGFPATDRAGVAGNVTVTAYDAYGNVATGYTGTIAFSSSDAQALLPSSFSFVAADAGTSTSRSRSRPREPVDHRDRYGDLEHHGH